MIGMLQMNLVPVVEAYPATGDGLLGRGDTMPLCSISSFDQTACTCLLSVIIYYLQTTKRGPRTITSLPFPHREDAGLVYAAFSFKKAAEATRHDALQEGEEADPFSPCY